MEYYFGSYLPFIAAGEGFVAIPASVLVQQYFLKKRPLAIALSTLGQAISALATAPLIRVLINVYAWRGAMLLSAAVSVQGLACAAVMRPIASNKQHQKPASSEAIQKMTQPDTKSESPEEVRKLTHGRPHGQKPPLTADSVRPPKMCFPHCQSCSITSVIVRSFDFSLWKRANFILLLLSRGLCMSSLWAMMMYAVPRAAFLGIDKLKASTVPFALGICSVMARFSTGAITNLKCTNRLLFYSAWQFVGGFLTALSAWVGYSLYTLFAIYGLFGLCSGMADISNS